MTEDYEDVNEGLKDCHTCYHPLEKHTNGVGCGAIREACQVENCCKHDFRPRWPYACRKCQTTRRRLSRCGHYHESGIICDEEAERLKKAWQEAMHRGGPLMVIPEAPELKQTRVQLHIILLNEGHLYFPQLENGWKVDAASRCIIVGKGVPRYQIPLDNVAYFGLEEY
jgi:hypothetical protein